MMLVQLFKKMKHFDCSWMVMLSPKKTFTVHRPPFTTSPKRYLTLLCSCFLLTFPVWSQTTQAINLETVLKLGGANNLTIQEYKHRHQLAIADMAKARTWWLPELYGGVQTDQGWGAAMNDNGKFFLEIEQQNLWLGLGLDLRWDFMDGIYRQKATKYRMQAQELETRAQRNQALLKTIDAYYDFASTQFYYQAYQELVNQGETINEQLKIQVDTGLRYSSELLLAQSNLNHLKIELLNAQMEEGKQAANLIQLLNLDPQTELMSVDTLMVPLQLIRDQVAPINYASIYEGRPEIQAMKWRLKAFAIEKKTTTIGLIIPEFRLSTFGAYYGGFTKELEAADPILFPTTKQLYPTTGLSMALLWRIPFGNFFYKGEQKQYDARMLIQETQIKQAEAQVNADLLASKNQLFIAAKQMAIAAESSQLSGEALEQSIQRQAAGTIRPFEILQAQEIFIQAKLDYLKAIAMHNKAQYRLYVAKGNNL